MNDPTISTNEIASFIGVSRMTIHRIITNLKNKGLIVRIGGDKGGHWKIKQ